VGRSLIQAWTVGGKTAVETRGGGEKVKRKERKLSGSLRSIGRKDFARGKGKRDSVKGGGIQMARQKNKEKK